MSFDSFNILGVIKKTLAKNKITEPTEIQAKTIPVFLEKKEFIACSSTGSGKTLAFLIPLINLLYRERYRSKPKHTRSLILAPTRELARQIEENIVKYSKGTKLRYTVITTGKDIGVQKHETSRGLDIIIATPGRLLTLFDKGHIKLNELEYLIVDEADLMLDMGFIRDIEVLAGATPDSCMTSMFSATFDEKSALLASEIMEEPVKFGVSVNTTIASGIEQVVAKLKPRYKPSFMLKIIIEQKISRGMVFVKTKKAVDRLTKFMVENGVKAQAIHGDLKRKERDEALENFTEGKINILVATDVAARGLHVDNISHIINYNLPMEPETYIHRLGRTGRGKARGFAASLCSPDEEDRLKSIEKLLGSKVRTIKVKREDAVYDPSKEISNGTRRPKKK